VFLFDRPAFIPGDLNNDEILGTLNAKAARIEEENVGVMLGDDLESVLLRNADANHCLIDDAADFLTVRSIVAFSKIDTSEGLFILLSLRSCLGGHRV
jgi:hypothetical protein